MVISIDVGGTKTRWGVVSRSTRKVIATSVRPTEQRRSDIVPTLYSGGAELLQSIGVDWRVVHQISIGVPGMVSTKGEIYNCPNAPEWENLDVSSLRENTGCSVRVVKDVNLAVMGEWNSQHSIESDLVVIYVGTGIGMGAIVQGSPLLGARGLAGEIGHWVVQADGEVCACGNRGCLETVASGSALEKAATALGYEKETAVASLLKGWSSGEERAAAAVNSAIHHLGNTVADLINLLDPVRIVLGGGVIEGTPELTGAIASVARAHARSRRVTQTVIETSQLGNQAPLIGGIWA